MTCAGLPHSEISGSKRACRSPKLIAAYCVLHRQITPRHPLIAVTGFMQTFNILDVYFTYFTFTIRLSNNKSIHLVLPPSFLTTIMVGPDGFEPSTPRLSSACSNQLSYRPMVISNSGGGERDRTDDPLLAKQVLSQLSYAPKPARTRSPSQNHSPPNMNRSSRDLVGQGGFEPPTPRLSSVCSNQLSY